MLNDVQTSNICSLLFVLRRSFILYVRWLGGTIACAGGSCGEMQFPLRSEIVFSLSSEEQIADCFPFFSQYGAKVNFRGPAPAFLFFFSGQSQPQPGWRHRHSTSGVIFSLSAALRPALHLAFLRRIRSLTHLLMSVCWTRNFSFLRSPRSEGAFSCCFCSSRGIAFSPRSPV